MRTTSVHIPVKRWFPPEDPIAILVVKLCILREDYLLELAGMTAGEDFNLESKPTYGEYRIGLDENSGAWRMAYFFRNSLKTLYEVKKEVETFFNDKKLKAYLASESRRFQDALMKLRRELTIAERAVERIRHSLGGHVDRGEIRKILRNMPDDTRALFQDSRISGKRRYKFVGEIVIRMFLPGIPEHALLAQINELLDETGELIPVFRTIDEVFAVYANDRKLTAE